MRTFAPEGLCTLVVLSLFSFAADSAASEKDPLAGTFGYDLFHREWSRDDPISPESGNGLGPLFNAKSCIACHNQGGSGGAGGSEHNVDLVTLTLEEWTREEALPNPHPSSRALFRSPAAMVHPDLDPVRNNSVVMHRFATVDGYEEKRVKWASQPPYKVLGAEREEWRRRRNGQDGQVVVAIRTQRNTPSLFGLGEINEIPTGVLEELAQHQNKKHPEISGRVAPGSGKFGWRGQTPTLRGFVVGACANELGLQTEDASEPGMPGDPFGPTGDTVDMYKEQVDAMVDYVAQLPAPIEQLPEGERELAAVHRGKRYFSAAGCAACHVRDVYNVRSVYSDMLLHDMGKELSDPAALMENVNFAGYYGSKSSLFATDEQKQEWMTPPLWGVRDSAPYLHDGRAATLEEAILAHGGEALKSRRHFERLRDNAREDLVTFLKTLGQPETSGIWLGRR